MKAVSRVLRVADLQGGGRMLLAWCPGCDYQHAWYVVDDEGRTLYDSSHTWTWNGDMDRPTIQASLVCHPHESWGRDDEPVMTPLCHSFVTDGVWDFLGDSTHRLSGQKVPMAPLPPWLTDDEYVVT